MNIYLKKGGACDSISVYRRCVGGKKKSGAKQVKEITPQILIAELPESMILHTPPKRGLTPPHPSHFLRGEVKAIVVGFPLP